MSKDRIAPTLLGYTKYRSIGHYAFLLHRISGLATLVFLTLHILTTATVFFAPAWYNTLILLFRNPLIMLIEIGMAFLVIYHGLNGARIAYCDLFRRDLLTKKPVRQFIPAVFILSIILWLPAAGILGYNLIHSLINLFLLQ